MEELFSKYEFDTVVNFAAESHVDRSITDPDIFLITNIDVYKRQPLAFAMTDESLGIQPMLSGAFDKILGGGVSGLFVFVIFITFLSAFSTQFLLNQIPGMVIFPIASAYCATLNVNPGMLACMITICANSCLLYTSRCV